MSSHERSRGVVRHRSQKTSEEILAYWTPERMAQAQPVSMPTHSIHRSGHEELPEARDEVATLPGRLPLAGEQGENPTQETLFRPARHEGVEEWVTAKIIPPRIYQHPFGILLLCLVQECWLIQHGSTFQMVRIAFLFPQCQGALNALHTR